MAGWGRLVVGAALGAVGALYATNEEFRKRLPEEARELPVVVRRRLKAARAAGAEASARRRAEILTELESHGGDHVGENRERLGSTSARAVRSPEALSLPESAAEPGAEPGGEAATETVAETGVAAPARRVEDGRE